MIDRVYRLNQQPNTIQLYLLGIWALGTVESIIAEGEILAGKQLLDRIKVEALFQHTNVVLSAIENLCDLSAWIVCVRAHTHALSHGLKHLDGDGLSIGTLDLSLADGVNINLREVLGRLDI